MRLLLLLILVSCSSVKMDNPFDKIQKEQRSFYLSWIKDLDPEFETGNLPIGTTTPLIHEDMVFVGTLAGQMNAYDIEKGTIVWSAKEAWPINAMASFHNDHIIYGAMNGRVYARHYQTGELKYSVDLGAPVESAPVVTSGRVFFHLRNHKIVSLDANSGKIIWSYRRSVPYTTTLQRVSKVLPYKNRVIVGFADGNVVSLSIEEGVVVWETKVTNKLKFVDVDIDPLYFGDNIVIGSAADKLRFLNPENGLIRRTVDLIAGHTPVKVGNEIVVGTIFGEVVRVNAEGTIVHKVKITKDGISSIVPWKNGFAVATMGQDIFHLEAKSFDSLGKFNLGNELSAIFGTLQGNSTYLVAYSSRNKLYVFKNI